MKLFSLLAFPLILLINSALLPTNNSEKLNKKANAKNGFAVVELFTSEGCSSCPPADRLIAKIQQEDKGQSVYILAFHVDYWNNSAWKDAFSSAEYSKRQSDYATWLNSGSIYTPQIVVNGNKEFIGSQENTLRNEIIKKLEIPVTTTLQLESVRKTESSVDFNYHTNFISSDTRLQIALVQKSGQTYVKRGENGGRTLTHIQIVRAFKTYKINANGNGAINMTVPNDLKNQNLEIIAFLQNTHNGQIVSATKSDL